MEVPVSLSLAGQSQNREMNSAEQSVGSSVSQTAWICSQIGAREHFAVPRALQHAGRPVTFCTDFWAGPLVRQFAVGKLRPLAARYHPDLENTGSTTICSWNWRALYWEKLLRQKSATQTPYHGFIAVGRRFAECVRDDLSRRAPESDFIFFAYDTGALETMAWCRDRKIKCVLNQMDPGRAEVDLVRAEEKNWPGWALRGVEVPEEYFVRREQEWSLADRIVVNSRWSFDALVKQGVPSEKLVVIPLCYESGEANRKSETGHRKANQPLRVLFLGQVILRKGIQYLIQAAKELEKENIRFDIVGAIGISAPAVKSAPANMIFHGRSTRDETAAWYQRSDLFALPTLSDGFALTQLEAMAHGLPVVTTPCCGEVVTDGVDGFIVPPHEVTALVQAFRRYLLEPELVKAQQAAALVKARQFTLDRLAENLISLEAGLK